MIKFIVVFLLVLGALVIEGYLIVKLEDKLKARKKSNVVQLRNRGSL